MSMWLSAANKIGGLERRLWTVELMRQQRLLTSELTKQSVRLLVGAWNLPRLCKLEKQRYAAGSRPLKADGSQHAAAATVIELILAGGSSIRLS